MIIKYKTCAGCKEKLELKSFNKSKRHKDGLRPKCKKCTHIENKRSRQYRRLKALLYYSNDKLECECCKENNLEFLTFDHINGGGRQHLISIDYKLLSWFERNNYPDGFRVLCMNCNLSLGAHGYCPHNEESKLVNKLPKNYDKKLWWKSKVTEDQALEIKKRYNSGESRSLIAKEFGIHHNTVYKIATGRRWKYLK